MGDTLGLIIDSLNIDDLRAKKILNRKDAKGAKRGFLLVLPRG
jgi:hypothetical protein